MKTIQFKTNIKCEGCVATVTPFLNAEENIEAWKVNTENPDKILSVSGTNLDPQRVENVLQKAGFKAEVLQVFGTEGEGL
jgi:copper chaperone